MTHTQAIETAAAERYLLDEMSEIERFRFEEHFFECEECAGQMRLGHQLRSGAREIFPERRAGEDVTTTTASVAAGASSRMSSRVVLPWAAAAVLAAGLAYQTMDPGRTRLDGDSLAVAPVVLRPASRGALPVVTIPERGSFAALSFDVQGAGPDQEIPYRLSREDGQEVQSGRARVSSIGTGLVLVPAERLTAGATYVLTTRGVDSTEPPAEYRFTTLP
jgi:hypothetical protein